MGDVGARTSFTDAGLSPGTTYSYTVIVYGADGYYSTPATITITTSAATAIAAGDSHTCALLAGGIVKCWGWNRVGALGNGTTTDSSTPVSVTGISDATAITSGFLHTCALVMGGAVKCWGYNFRGQLGNGTTTNSSTPVTVTGISDATAIDAGREHHTCALVAGGAVKCWGGNLDGQLGNGTTTPSSTPVSVIGISDATAITAGGFHTCALVAGGALKCWGRNQEGQLGNGTTGYTVSTPVSVTGISDGTGLTAGDVHTCALSAGGAVKCWGDNRFGELGNGTTTDSSTPLSVTGIGDATAITAGAYHMCALVTGGAVSCWGYNIYGQLGNGTTTDSSTPVTVTGL